MTTIRTHTPSDLPWVVARHGTLYATEYGFDKSFESLCAGIVDDFAKNHDPAKERCWIAESTPTIHNQDHQNERPDREVKVEALGCIMLVRDPDPTSTNTAKLRLFLVEPSARGRGVGSGLLKECIRFAREAGYERVVLWTQSVLEGARRMYSAQGFQLVREEEHKGFGGGGMTGEHWELFL